MLNFTYHNPTKIIFGKDTTHTVGYEVAQYSKKVLFHYGSGSIKKRGLYDEVIKSLTEAGIQFVELGGVKANPRLSLVQEGIKICREQNLDFILAVGGGSVIDSAKAIAVGVLYDGDVWDFFNGEAGVPEQALPIGTILTIPAAGSEASTGCVITNEIGGYKKAFNSEAVYPKFSILDPQMCFSLPKYQIACGVTDMMAHIMERYFTTVTHVDLTDRLCEANLQTIILNAKKVLENQNDYDSWAEIMWSGTIAHNNLLNTGRIGDWASHDIEHELSGIYDIAHGSGLAIVFPAWMKYVYKIDIRRFAQYAQRVWGIESNGDEEKMAFQGIERLEQFFREIGLATKLSEIGISSDKFEEMADKCTNSDSQTVGNFLSLTKKDIVNIYMLAL